MEEAHDMADDDDSGGETSRGGGSDPYGRDSACNWPPSGTSAELDGTLKGSGYGPEYTSDRVSFA